MQPCNLWTKTLRTTETKQKQNRMPKQPWNVLTVLANHSRYPLFMAWRANSGHSLRLAKTTETFHCCFVSAEIKLFYFRFISTVWTAQRAGKPGGLRLYTASVSPFALAVAWFTTTHVWSCVLNGLRCNICRCRIAWPILTPASRLGKWMDGLTDWLTRRSNDNVLLSQ